MYTDSYSTNDIIFDWNATSISVGAKELAQFEYKGAALSSNFDHFSTGEYICLLDNERFVF